MSEKDVYEGKTRCEHPSCLHSGRCYLRGRDPSELKDLLKEERFKNCRYFSEMLTTVNKMSRKQIKIFSINIRLPF